MSISTLAASKPASAILGDNLRVMTRACESVQGVEYPAGTLFRPLSSGFNNMWNRSEVVVLIDGARVSFE